MGSADWTVLANSLDSSSVTKGATSSPSPPTGGGSFIYGFDSKVDTDGAVGLYVNSTGNPNHAPAAKGMSVRGAVMRGVSSLKTGFSPFMFACLQASASPAVSDQAYMIGLEDADPYRIVVVKGQIINGVPAATALNSLLRSTATYTVTADQWHHLRMDCIVQGTGDVIIQCFESDVDSLGVTAPVWTAIPGMEEFTDDALGVASGSLPFTDGYCGYGMASEEQGRRSYFDHMEFLRQL